MPESPEDLFTRVSAVAPFEAPSYTRWDVYPFGGDVVVRALQPPVAAEAPRAGEGGEGCARCAEPDRNVVWRNERWTVASTEEPTGMPLVLFLEPVEHLDYTDLDDEMAAEHGRLSMWLTRIVEGLPHVGRVHSMRIGDGAEHLHTWFFARPERFAQVRGSFVVEWDDILPPVPVDLWRDDLAKVAQKLSWHDGHPV